jgi:broad specificity phosphatase PhoE
MKETQRNVTAKRVYAIRHGQSEFNVLYDLLPSEEERYHSKMKVIDCDVTALGKQQSLEAGKRLAEQLATITTTGRIDYMMISPLRRALQTAAYVLESFTEHTPVVEISELCSEVLLDSCDIGTVPTDLAKEFPQWNFSALDHFWWHGGLDSEETWELLQRKQIQEKEEDVERRLSKLKSHLRKLNADTIVVVCHSDVICYLTSELKEDGERAGTYPKNGEIIDVTQYVLQ